MAKLTDVSGRPHSGLVSNAVVALVIDNVDPEQLGRVKVKFPTLHEEPESFWLRQASPNGGIERGLYALPEVDDEVLVIFMQGSQDVGIIIGQFWNGVDIPPQEAFDAMPVPGDTWPAERSTFEFSDGSKNHDNNDRRFWKSRSGHLFVFDDTDGSETVQIWDGSHTCSIIFDTANQAMVISNNAGDMHIRAANDLYLEAGNDLIYTVGNNMDGLVHNDKLEMVDMNWEHETGMDTTITAGMNLTTDAGMDHTGKAGMNYNVSGGIAYKADGGATAEISGGAMTTVKGGVVMIN